jgi:hypothetical protein
MLTSTIIFTGTAVVEGVAFEWWVTDGLAQRLTVSHPTLGTETQELAGSPAAQARAIARAMLAQSSQEAGVGLVDDIDRSMPEGALEPTIVLGED